MSSLSVYLVGFIVVSSGLLLLAFTAPVPMWLNFGILSVAAVVPLFLPRVRTGWRRLSFGKIEVFALLLIVTAAGFWSQENLESIAVNEQVAVSHPWRDVPFHSVQISLFAHSQGAGSLSNPLMSGQPVPLYHYGSYMIASLLCRLTGLDAYSLTTGWYAPMALVLTGLAAWSLGSSLLGSAAGLAAVFGTMLIPDPSYYWLGNRWTSYFFFQTVNISAAYAVSTLGASWAFFFAFLRTDTIRLLIAAFVFCALSAVFKSLIFLVYSFGLLLFATLFAKRIGGSMRLLLAALWIANLLGLLFVSQQASAPTLALSSSGARVNLDEILKDFPPSSFGWLRQSVHDQQSYFIQLVLGVPIILLSTYGLCLFACCAAVWLSVRRRLHPAWTLFPIFVLANHLFVALCLDANHGTGDTFEIIHKLFVFPYFAVTAWTAATLFSQFEGSPPRSPIRNLLLVGASAAALLGVYQAGKTVQSGLPWARDFTGLTLPRGLYDAAQFIREGTPAEAVVQYSENDGLAMLAALGERKSFVLSYTEPPFTVLPEEASRTQAVAALLHLPAADAAKEMAGVLGIDWLLLADTRQPEWAGQLSADFESRGFRLYHLRRSEPR